MGFYWRSAGSSTPVLKLSFPGGAAGYSGPLLPHYSQKQTVYHRRCNVLMLFFAPGCARVLVWASMRAQPLNTAMMEPCTPGTTGVPGPLLIENLWFAVTTIIESALSVMSQP